MQEIATYIILALTVGYVVFKLAKLFVKVDKKSQCETMGCSGCSFRTGCKEEQHLEHMAGNNPLDS